MGTWSKAFWGVVGALTLAVASMLIAVYWGHLPKDKWLGSDAAGIVGWVGLVASLLGLKLTYDQAANAAQSSKNADDAASAAGRAVEEMKSRLGATVAAFSYSQIHMMVTLVNTGELAEAHAHFGHINRALRLKSGFNDSGELNSPEIDKALKAIDKQFTNYRIKKEFNSETVHKYANILLHATLKWEHDMVNVQSGEGK